MAVAALPTFKYTEAHAAEAERRSVLSERAAASVRGSMKGRKRRQSVASVASALDEKDLDPTCAICLANFIEGEELRLLPCQHTYHRACVDQWFNVSQECPLCKRSILSPAGTSVVAAAQAAERAARRHHTHHRPHRHRRVEGEGSDDEDGRADRPGGGGQSRSGSSGSESEQEDPVQTGRLVGPLATADLVMTSGNQHPPNPGAAAHPPGPGPRHEGQAGLSAAI